MTFNERINQISYYNMINYNQILVNLEKQFFNASLQMKRKYIIKKLFAIN